MPKVPMAFEAEDNADKTISNWYQGDYVCGVNEFVFLDLDESDKCVAKHIQPPNVIGCITA